MSNLKSKDLKNQILERIKISGKSIKEIAKEHGIASSVRQADSSRLSPSRDNMTFFLPYFCYTNNINHV